VTDDDINIAVQLTEGYTAADIVALVKEVAMIPVREVPTEKLLQLKDISEVRGIMLKDF
jgi:SpoVK/Ycf46/Vps4 family AAA+-type ATPase